MSKHRITTLALLTAILTAGCSNDDATNYAPPTPVSLSTAESRAIDGGNDLSIELFKNMCSAQGSENVFYSPLLTTTNLAILANGAGGNTRSEIMEALGYPQNEEGLADLNSAYSKLLSVLPITDSRTRMNVATSLWSRPELIVKEAFSNSCMKYYNSELLTLTGQSTTDVDNINVWCSRKTSGAIPQLIDEPKDLGDFALVNAADFKGFWKEPFEKSNTKKETFTTTDGRTCKVDMMHLTATTRYAENDHAKILEKDFGNGAFAIRFILPADETMALNDFIAGYDFSLDRTPASHKVIISLPRLNMEGKYYLKGAIKQTGIKEIFDDNADFSGLTELPCKVTDILQKSRFIMDESGAEAQAAEVGDWCTANPGSEISFRGDRPFIFLIKETTSGSILFIGKVEKF